MAGYLPPVVITVVGEDADFLAMIARDKAILADWAGQLTNTQLGADDAQVISGVAAAKAIVEQFGTDSADAKLGVDDGAVEAAFYKLEAELAAIARQITNAPIGADLTTQFFEQLAEIKEYIRSSGGDAQVGFELAPGALAELRAMVNAATADSIVDMHVGIDEASVAHTIQQAILLKAEVAAILGQTDMVIDVSEKGLAGVVAETAAAKAASGGLLGGAGAATGGGLLGNLLWGGGTGFMAALLSPLTGLQKLFSASFGSLGSLAGFGPEHAILTGVGLAGSLGGAGLGAGLLGLGSLGVAGVGMGTDMAGLGQAAGDIKNVTSAQTALNNAILGYGPASIEAADAQAQLTIATQTFSPVARAAVVQVSNMAQQFKSQFDQVTGAAEKTGAQIIGQFIQLGEKFLPTIGKYAAENMDIIQKGLQPLIQWIGGPGLAIFTELEAKFQKDLPSALQALTNGFELLIRTIGLVAPKTGGLISSIDKFVTKYNGVDWDRWVKGVDKLIAIFRVWDSFAKILAKDVFDIFGKSAGLGVGIIELLTGKLQGLHAGLQGLGGQQLSTLFTVHKAEILALITAILNVGKAFTSMYLIAAPVLVQVATLVLRVLDAVLEFVNHFPGGSTFLGFFLLAGKLGILRPLFLGVRGDAGLLETTLANIGKMGGRAFVSLLESLGGVAAAMLGVETESVGLRIALGALSTVGVILLGVAIYEMVKHLGAFRTALIVGAVAVGVITASFLGLDIASGGLIPAIGALAVAILYLATHWKQSWTDIKHVFDDAVTFLRSGFGTLILLLQGPIGVMLLIALHWQQLWSVIRTVGTDIVNFFVGLNRDITHALDDLSSALYTAGKDAIMGLVHGIEDAALAPVHAIQNVGKSILHGLSDVVGWLSPWSTTIQAGSDASAGLAQGITGNSATAVNAAKTVANQITTAFGSLTQPAQVSASVKSLEGIFSGLAGAFNAFASAANNAASVAGNLNAVKSAVSAFAEAAPKVLGPLSSVGNAFAKFTAGPQIKAFAGTLWNVAAAFKAFGAAARAASGVSAGAIFSLVVGLGALAKDAPKIDGAISGIVNAFKGLGSLKAVATDLSSVTKVFANVGILFVDFGKAASAASSVTVQAVQSMLAGLQGLTDAAPWISAAIGNIVEAFSQLDETKKIGNDLAQLSGVFNALGKVFSAFGGLAKSSSDISVLAMIGVLVAMQRIQGFANAFVPALQGVEKEFSKLGNLSDLENHLNSLSGDIMALGKVFQSLSGAAQAAAGVTPQALGQITTAVQQLGSALGQMAGDINSAAGPALSALNSMVSQMLAVLNGSVGQFSSAGQSIGAAITQGITAGVTANAGAAAAAAAAAGASTIAAGRGSVRAQSPSLDGWDLGRDIVLGTALGISQNAGLLQQAYTRTIAPFATVGGAGAGAAGGGANWHVEANFNIYASSANDGAAIKQAIGTQAAEEFAKQIAVSVRAGAGTVYS